MPVKISKIDLILINSAVSQLISLASTLAEVVGKTDVELKRMIDQSITRRKAEINKIYKRQGKSNGKA